MNKIHKAQVIKNLRLNDNVSFLSLKISSEIEVKPGQFFLLKTNLRFDPLLGRPLSVFNFESGILDFLYRIKGKGTKILSTLKVGEEIQINGPFGRWYPFPESEYVVIAGGIGIASLFYLIKKFPKRAYLFYGARERGEVFFYNELKDLSKELCISTECGSFDYRGVVTEAFKERGLELNLPIYACGPMAMIGELKRIISDKQIPCYVAVEERMACGIGACLGCVIETEEGFKRVCTEGPVFNIKELKI